MVLMLKAILQLLSLHLKHIWLTKQYYIKCLAKLSCSLLLTALYSLQFSAFTYMRRINYNSATVNISVFIELKKHSISE